MPLMLTRSVSGSAMNRRAFVAFTGFGFALPLLAASAQADELEAGTGTGGKPTPRPTTPSAALSVDEIVTRLEARYDKTTTFKAGFSVRSLGTRYDPRKVAKGRVSFELPGKMSWRYAHTGNRVVSDGTQVKIYDSENKQLYELELERTVYPAALSFLIDQGKLGKNFEFARADSKHLSRDGNHVLTADPLQPSRVFDRLLFYVDAQSYQMRALLIRDLQGNRTRFDFVASKPNAPVPPGEFAFSPPSGTQIIRVPARCAALVGAYPKT